MLFATYQIANLYLEIFAPSIFSPSIGLCISIFCQFISLAILYVTKLSKAVEKVAGMILRMYIFSY